MTEEREYQLLSCNSLSEFLSMFWGLGYKEKQSVFTEQLIVKKGTEFYRARKASSFDTSEYANSKQWTPVPKEKAHQGRFNGEKESVLYVASDTDCLGREICLQEGEEYFLAKYICKKSFSVGTFLSTNNLVNTLAHRIAMAVSSPFDLTDRENELIDEYYLKIRGLPIREIALDSLASLYIYKLIPSLYDVTNRFGKIVLNSHKCGIRYSSVYVPIELSGGPQILTLDGLKYGNYVLTQKGYEHLELVSVERMIYHETGSLENMIKIFAEEEME